MQGKLLRVLQEKEFYRVGGLKKIKTDVRIICATNVNIEKKVKDGAFREDLYYRLKVGHIVVPPLRIRQDDIIHLANMFLLSFSKQKEKHFSKISASAAKILLEYQWPGNVRELRNAMEWVVFMYDDQELKPTHLEILIKGDKVTFEEIAASNNYVLNPLEFSLPQEGFLLDEYINSIIIKSLELHHSNKSETARYLGITRRSLYCRLEHRVKLHSEGVRPPTEC